MDIELQASQHESENTKQRTETHQSISWTVEVLKDNYIDFGSVYRGLQPYPLQITRRTRRIALLLPPWPERRVRLCLISSFFLSLPPTEYPTKRQSTRPTRTSAPISFKNDDDFDPVQDDEGIDDEEMDEDCGSEDRWAPLRLGCEGPVLTTISAEMLNRFLTEYKSKHEARTTLSHASFSLRTRSKEGHSALYGFSKSEKSSLRGGAQGSEGFG